MLSFLAVPLCALALSGATVEDGQAWIKKAEEQLYRWPATRVLVRFEAHTDLLAPMIAAMKADLEKKPDAEASRFVAALEKVALHGSIDTATGKLDTEVSLDYRGTDPRTQRTIETVKQRLQSTLAGCFASMPLQDPALLRKNGKVDSAEQRDKELLVTSNGVCPGDSTVLHLARDTGLPMSVEMPQMTIEMTYTQVAPGRFVPASLDIASKVAPSSRIEVSWQHAGELWFPEHVQLSSKAATAKLDFDHLAVVPRGR
jgi:hypothetical protein